MPLSQLNINLEVIMYKSYVIKYFNSAAALARTLNINRASISTWNEIIPEKRALQIERITAGALTYDPALYIKSPFTQNKSSKTEYCNKETNIGLAKCENF